MTFKSLKNGSTLYYYDWVDRWSFMKYKAIPIIFRNNVNINQVYLYDGRTTAKSINCQKLTHPLKPFILPLFAYFQLKSVRFC